MTLSRDIAAAWRNVSYREVPRDVVELAKLHLLDAIGVGLAATKTEIGQAYLAAAAAQGDGPASVIGAARRLPVEMAALINGGLIHAMEYDDTHVASIVHGSSVVAPAVLAAAQSVTAGGEETVAAFVKGWEVLVRIGLAAPGAFQAKGFQVTSVAGALVAALLAAQMLGLDDVRSANAMGIALSQASGVFEFVASGASVKSMHPGWAAHAGLIAAALARAGISGPPTTFEGGYGLFRQFADSTHGSDRLREGLRSFGVEWHLRDAAFKFVPCCHYIHPFVEGAAELARKGATSDTIEHVVLKVPAGAAPIICEPWEAKTAPASGHAARHSLPIVVAACLVHGRVDHDTFAHPPSADLVRLAKRMSWAPLEQSRFPQRFEALMEARLVDGRCFEARVDDVFGGPNRPATPEHVIEKFRTNATRICSEECTARLERAIMFIENIGIEGLGAALADVPKYAAQQTMVST